MRRENKFEYFGLTREVLNRPDVRMAAPYPYDTFVPRHSEKGRYTWLWVLCDVATVRIKAVLNPILNRTKCRLSKYTNEQLRSVRVSQQAREVIKRKLSHREGRKSLGVFTALVNRVAYRKPHHKPYIQHNGWTRPESGLATPFKNFCPHCTELIVNGSQKRVRITKGVYLPIEHECNSVRVYNLKGNLLEVKGT